MNEKLTFSITGDGAMIEWLPNICLQPLVMINEHKEILIQGNAIGIISETGQVIFKTLSAGTSTEG